jgi:hypothetical protein
MISLFHGMEIEMSQPEQEYLTAEDMLREQLAEERLLRNHLILALAKLSVDGCRQVIKRAPHISMQSRREALEYVDDLVHDGKCG